MAAFVLFGLFSFTTIRICYTPFQRLLFRFFRNGIGTNKKNKNRKFTLLPEILYHCEKNQTKVLGREFEGDSPQCGEMSEGQRGPPLLAEPFFKRVSLNNKQQCQKKRPANAPETYQNPNFSALALPESRDSR